MTTKYQELTQMWVFHGLVGVVAMWSSMLSPSILVAFEPMTIIDYLDDLVSSAL